MQQFTSSIELTVGKIAERCALKPSTASEHLSLLRRGGLMISRKKGKQVFYRADGATMAKRISALQAYRALCCSPDCTG
ncbi:ArsR/SmtB family transcription factor [Streptomyces sp. NPDC057486]|uniref:ArsR/SmtB family transcription factor n=1 Tax=Streptomyces sp. NPDC057486 TaxID=3346145 RepID=UPI00369B342B